MWARLRRSGSLRLTWKSGPRSMKWASGSASRCQMITRMERPTATRAFLRPRRRGGGPESPPPAGEAPIALAEEGVGPAGADGCFTDDLGKVAVAVPGSALADLLAGRFLGPGGEAGPGAQVGRGGKAAHVRADLGQDGGCGDPTNSGHLIELGHDRCERGNHLLDRRLEICDVGAQAVDAGEHLGQ